MAALGGLSPQKRGRGQETVLKVKLPFSETSQVPGAAGNTVRIFFRNGKNKTKQNTNRWTVAQHWASSPRVPWRGASVGFKPRNGKLRPEAVPLPVSLAPGLHSEAQMQLLKTLGRDYFDSHHLTD